MFDVEVFFDGLMMGKVFIDCYDFEVGKYYFIVCKDGYEEFKCEVYFIEG